MITVEQMRNVAQDLIASYDDRVDAIGAIIDNTYQALDDFKDKRAKLSGELKETLAKRGSLRKKDFDRMMNGILLSQEEKEKEVKQSLKNFIGEQKKEARELKDALTKGEVERIKKAQIGIEKGVAEIKGSLKDFCEQQETLTDQLRKLLTKGEDLKIKELQDTIRNLQTLTGREEVKRMGLADVAMDIRSLGQDMATSHVDRTASIEALSNETKEMINTFQNEHAERKAELNEMLESFTENLHKEVHKFMKGVHSENAQQRQEVSDLLASFQEYMKGAHNEVGRLAAAVKEMWSTVAGVKRGTKKVSALCSVEAEEKKPARRAKVKSKKVQSLYTR
jgi:uncharacterized protein YoxC